MERVDLGPCRAIRHDGKAERCALLLPGLFYPTRAPALWFAREAAMARGWSALEILGEPGEHEDPLAWERECAERAIERVGSVRPLVIGKSLTSLLTGWIADLDVPAIWLTPLLDRSAVIDGLARTRRPALLVGGTADPTWRRAALPDSDESMFEVLEIEGADHSLQVTGNPAANLRALERMTDAITQFLDRV